MCVLGEAGGYDIYVFVLCMYMCIDSLDTHWALVWQALASFVRNVNTFRLKMWT